MCAVVGLDRAARVEILGAVAAHAQELGLLCWAVEDLIAGGQWCEEDADIQ
ncbi:hypothetical protein ACFY20_42225 [Streptomyces sp. NPDC001312]|uniref:hypothetical protein n=1 Tax=Streptomyces sp. NPDC001312 TaxID=3364561 RepID=UPI0036740FFC